MNIVRKDIKEDVVKVAQLHRLEVECRKEKIKEDWLNCPKGLLQVL